MAQFSNPVARTWKNAVKGHTITLDFSMVTGSTTVTDTWSQIVLWMVTALDIHHVLE